MSITSVIVPDHSHYSQIQLGLLSDAELLALQTDLAASRRQLDAITAKVSGEVAKRSARDLGYGGLAQRLGARTPEGLVQRLTGVTRAEARSLVRVGEALDGSSPWLSGVAKGVESGSLSVAAADGIIAGLGAPTPDVAADDLADAAGRLIEVAGDIAPERTAAAARALRDELDSEGVADREEAMRERRFLRLIPEADGMTRIIGRLDPESAAIVSAAVDRVTAPRRGGPRFVDSSEVARARRLVDDARSTEQIALDALVDMVKIASKADEGTVFGVRAPEVHVHVELADLEAHARSLRGDGTQAGTTNSGEATGAARRGRPAGRVGVAHFEGQRAGVSINTAERYICASGAVPILFDKSVFNGGRPLDLGRTSRLYSPSQRTALGVRDGGCVFPACDRPPSWCEAHHINEWEHDHGRTDIEDGVLLCRHHHMLLHNNGWRIERRGAERVLIPPASVDPARAPRPLQSTATRRAERAHALA